MSYTNLVEMYNFLNNEEGLKNFVTNFNDPSGFVWSNDIRVDEIFRKLNNNDHSPASFALCLRACQSIFKGNETLESYKSWETNMYNNPA
jgi:hypothetical protein